MSWLVHFLLQCSSKDVTVNSLRNSILPAKVLNWSNTHERGGVLHFRGRSLLHPICTWKQGQGRPCYGALGLCYCKVVLLSYCKLLPTCVNWNRKQKTLQIICKYTVLSFATILHTHSLSNKFT